MYPSYISLLRTGAIPSESAYGLSGRVIVVPDLALFGYPMADGAVNVKSISRVLKTRVQYDLKFGSAGVASCTWPLHREGIACE